MYIKCPGDCNRSLGLIERPCLTEYTPHTEIEISGLGRGATATSAPSPARSGRVCGSQTPRLCVAALGREDTGSGSAAAFLSHVSGEPPTTCCAPRPAPCLRAGEVVEASATAEPRRPIQLHASPPACSTRAPAGTLPRAPLPALRARPPIPHACPATPPARPV